MCRNMLKIDQEEPALSFDILHDVIISILYWYVRYMITNGVTIYALCFGQAEGVSSLLLFCVFLLQF